MSTTVDVDITDRVLSWVKERANEFGIAVEVFPAGVVRDGNWFHVPVAVRQEGDAYDRATWLQRIEDAWDPSLFDGGELLLVPARPSEPSKSELFEQVADLMKRQTVLLDRIGDQGDDISPADVERFQSVRKELEELALRHGQDLPIDKKLGRLAKHGTTGSIYKLIAK